MSTNINRLGSGGMKGIQALAAPGELGCEMTRVSNVSVVWPVAVRTNSRVQGRCHSNIAGPAVWRGGRGLYTTHLGWWRNDVADCATYNKADRRYPGQVSSAPVLGPPMAGIESDHSALAVKIPAVTSAAQHQQQGGPEGARARDGITTSCFTCFVAASHSTSKDPQSVTSTCFL